MLEQFLTNNERVPLVYIEKNAIDILSLMSLVSRPELQSECQPIIPFFLLIELVLRHEILSLHETLLLFLDAKHVLPSLVELDPGLSKLVSLLVLFHVD